MTRSLRTAAAVAGLALLAPLARADTKFTPEEVAFFDKEVKPVLQQNCVKCHGGEKVRGALRLTTRDGVLKGGDNGPAAVPGKPDESLLVKAINRRDGLEMPPKKKLTADEIAALTKWVKMGLPWPAGKGEIVSEEPKGGVVTEEAKNYWCYRPVKRPEVPAVKDREWVRNPIDAFLLAKVEAKGLTPAPPADRVALVRRAYYDLTGLPPTPGQVDAFVGDRSAGAWERLIDRLLDSPQYGEKWGRHWLDVVRFAETNGYERDGPKPFAWRYRDYVINSFNDDKPFDQFVREQLAGDERPGYHPDAVIATGFYRLGLWDDEPADPQQARLDELDDFVTTTGQGLLGMSLNCARCHEHKRDPIPQADYYRLLAFFADVPRYDNNHDTRSAVALSDVSLPELRATYEEELKKRESRKAELTAALTKIEDGAIKKMPAEDQRAAEGPDRPQILRKIRPYLGAGQAEEYAKMRQELASLRKVPQPPGQTLALSVNHCPVNPPDTFVMVRGSPRNPGAKVEPGFPTVLGFPAPALPMPEKGAKSSGRRTVLANWVASKDNPLTARVFVNRLWQHHFGRGIVPTPNDFGKLGEAPTHPELLDWLADEFMKGGWRVKRMHRLIMTSAAYQMSAKADDKGLKLDPANTLFWRFNMRRLTAEEVRDSILAASGRLNLKAGGPGVYPKIPREVLQGQSMPGNGWGQSPPEEAARRSVYVHVKRSLLVPILSHHDQADTDSSCPVRYTTTVPTQALGMLNGEFTNEQAAAFAERLRREAPDDLAAQVRRAIRLTTGRRPGDDEVGKDVAFIKDMRTKHGLTEEAALKQYCLLMLNTNEFVYVD
jgi:mono/diheme cytochrome c family protein